MLKGQFIDLRPLTCDDITTIVSWCMDNELAMHYMGTPLFSPEEIRRYFEDVLKDSSGNRFFVMLKRREGTPIGFVSLENINWRHRTTTYAVFIGVRGERRKEYVMDSLVRCMDYAFEALNIHRFEIRMYAVNRPIVQGFCELMELTRDDEGNWPFVHDGRLREAAYLLGEYTDVEIYGILQPEYRKARRRFHRAIRGLYACGGTS